MGELAREHCPELLADATAELGDDPFERMDEGTVYLQPAIFLGTLAHWRASGAPIARFAAGHSVGELAALTAANHLSPEEGLRMVLARAQAMQHAADSGEPGGLLATIGSRERALDLADSHGLELAADNAPEQLVLSGALAKLRAAQSEARSRGLKAVRLRVPAALHSSAMAAAVEPFRRALETASFESPRMIVIANVTGRPFTDPVSELALGVTSCVRWRQTVLTLHDAGVGAYAEMGSDILSGLLDDVLAQAPPSEPS